MEKVGMLTHFMDANINRTVCRVIKENLSDWAIYGAGMYGRKLVDALLSERITPSVIFDSTLGASEKTYKNIPIVKPDRMFDFKVSAFVIGSVDFHSEIERKISSLYKITGKPPFFEPHYP